MLAVFKWIHIVALAVWLGAVVFFSFVVAPRVFGALPQAQAGQVVSAIFPSYYALGYCCGVLLVISSVLLWRARGQLHWMISAGLAVLMLLATLYAGLVVQPSAQALRASLHDPAAPPTVKAEFDHLHSRAVQLNAAVLLGALVMSALTAARTEP